jgi:hypothetical protein
MITYPLDCLNRNAVRSPTPSTPTSAAQGRRGAGWVSEAHDQLRPEEEAPGPLQWWCVDETCQSCVEDFRGGHVFALSMATVLGCDSGVLGE